MRLEGAPGSLAQEADTAGATAGMPQALQQIERNAQPLPPHQRCDASVHAADVGGALCCGGVGEEVEARCRLVLPEMVAVVGIKGDDAAGTTGGVDDAIRLHGCGRNVTGVCPAGPDFVTFEVDLPEVAVRAAQVDRFSILREPHGGCAA